MQNRILALYLPPPLESDSLPKLAETLLLVSPRIGIRPPDTLYLDVSHAEKQFGSESALVRKIQQRLTRIFRETNILQNIRMVVADDVATAGVLTRFETKNQIIAKGNSEKALQHLPLHALHFLANPNSCPPSDVIKQVQKTIDVLSLLGIKTLREFARLPVSSIGTRFGSLGAELHQRARGIHDSLILSFIPKHTYRKSFFFDQGIHHVEPAYFAAQNLLAKLERELQAKQESVCAIRLFLEMENAEELEISIDLIRPLHSSRSILPLIKEKLSHVTLESPFISFTIELLCPIQNHDSQFHLFDHTEKRKEELDDLLGRLVSGIGPKFISAAELRQRYRPESSWNKVSFDPNKLLLHRSPPERPTYLLEEPIPLQAFRPSKKLYLKNHRKNFPIRSLKGPERLMGEWWDGKSHARDYFIAETETGENLWIYKDWNKNRIFLHGYFD